MTAHKWRASLMTTLTWVLVLGFFFPVLWMVLNAFKTEEVAASVTPRLFFEPTLAGFERLGDRGVGDYLRNSVLASVPSTVLAVTLAFPAAYALSIRPVRRVRDTLFYFISTRFMPMAAAVLPLYILLKNLGLLDRTFSLVLVYAAMNLPIAVWMLRSFLTEVPREVIEAARVDGAGLRTEMVRIVLPLVMPGVAAAALICFIFAWNEYFLATLLTSSDTRTLPPFLASFVDGRGLFLGVLSTAATVAALPVVIAGWVAQKQLVRGLSLGSVK